MGPRVASSNRIFLWMPPINHLPPRHWSDRLFRYPYVEFDQLRHNDTSNEVEGILQIASRYKSTGQSPRLVELACGYGRLLVPLATRLDSRPTGIDKSSYLLKIAQLRASEAHRAIELVCADLLSYRGRADFDLALLIGTSFGYYGEESIDSRVLDSARSMLVRGGTLILDQFNNPPDFCIHETSEQFLFRVETVFDSATRVFQGCYQYIERSTNLESSRQFFIRLYTESDLAALLACSGFEIVEVLGGLDSSAFHSGGRRLVVVARAR